jgi:hypothetical protein
VYDAPVDGLFHKISPQVFYAGLSHLPLYKRVFFLIHHEVKVYIFCPFTHVLIPPYRSTGGEVLCPPPRFV